MIELTIETKNLPENQSFKDLLLSMLTKAFSRKKEVKSVMVVVSKTDDARVPYTVEMNLEETNSTTLQSKAVSVNYLSAFSQALNRMERQLEKKRA